MTITQVGTTTYFNNGPNSNTSVPVAWPAGAADGDLAVLMYAQERSAVFPTLSSMLPGWDVTVGGDANGAVLIATKFIVPADLTQPPTIGTLTSARRGIGALQTWRSAGAPVILAGAIISGGGSVPALTTPAVVATAANGIEISMFGLRSTAVGPTSATWVRTVTPAAGYTEDLDQSTTSTSTSNGILHISHKAVTASGAQATASHTVNEAQTQVIPYAIYIPDGNTRLATPATTPSTKTNATAPGATDGTQVVTWAAVPNATAYTVQVATGASATTGFVTRTTTATSPYTVTGLGAGTYTIRVIATP
jgi:hypothetical protein